MQDDLNVKRSANEYVDKDREILDKTNLHETQEGVSMVIDTENFVNKRREQEIIESFESALQKKFQSLDVMNVKFSEPKAELVFGDNELATGKLNVSAKFVYAKETKIGSFTVKIAEGVVSIDNEEFEKQIQESKSIEVEESEDSLDKAINEASDFFTKSENKKSAELGIDDKGETMSIDVGNAPRSFQKQKNACPDNFGVGTEINISGIDYKVSAEDTNQSAWIFTIVNP